MAEMVSPEDAVTSAGGKASATHFPHPERLTNLAKAVSAELRSLNQPVIGEYQLFRLLTLIYLSGRKLYLRHQTPGADDLRRVVSNLKAATTITRDEDYPRRVWRIVRNREGSADEICCLADPFCYVSRLSAMRRYGFTDRLPRYLQLAVPAPTLLPDLIKERIRSDYPQEDDTDKDRIDMLVPLYRARHPKKVRGEHIEVTQCTNRGRSIAVRGSFARIATVGQVFLEMLEDPQSCGGMSHVLDVWEQHAENYLNDIVVEVDAAPKSIHKVRAGYILEELLGIDDERVASWKRFAQRGGSRLLDPTKPYAPTFSEVWMISLNAG